MFRKHVQKLLVGIFCFMFAATLAVAQQSNANLSSSGQQFLDHLAKDSQGEVQLAQMVMSKTSNPQVKEFAERIVHDHTMLDNQVHTVMSKHGMSMPSALTQGQEQLRSKLSGMSGSQLDRAYIDAEVQNHQKAVQDVSQQAQADKQLQPSDPDVAEVAQEALPVLKDHLQLAQQIQTQLGSGGMSQNSSQ